MIYEYINKNIYGDTYDIYLVLQFIGSDFVCKFKWVVFN